MPKAVAAGGGSGQADHSQADPGRDCPLCPRLVEFRSEARAREPDWYNAPVRSFGDADGRLLIVGLAPGLRGANRTGRPFTGDHAGELLYATLLATGFATGTYAARPDDGLTLVDCRITNAVRCVPPENKPTPAEIRTCRTFLLTAIGASPRLTTIVALGRVAHDSVVRSLGESPGRLAFAHGREFVLRREAADVALFDSYHCSRYNTNTGVLTARMFRELFERVRLHVDASASPRA